MKFAESLERGPHKSLNALCGEWEGVNKVWGTPGELTDEQPVRGTFRPLLGGKFVLHEYKTTVSGGDASGLAIIAYFLYEQRYKVAWVDGFHTGTEIQVSTGQRAAVDLDVHTTYPVGPGEPDWGWRTVIDQPSADTLYVRHYNITPQGEEALGIEFAYRRK